jgi:hypothetical protein
MSFHHSNNLPILRTNCWITVESVSMNARYKVFLQASQTTVRVILVVPTNLPNYIRQVKRNERIVLRKGLNNTGV